MFEYIYSLHISFLRVNSPLALKSEFISFPLLSGYVTLGKALSDLFGPQYLLESLTQDSLAQGASSSCHAWREDHRSKTQQGRHRWVGGMCGAEVTGGKKKLCSLGTLRRPVGGLHPVTVQADDPGLGKHGLSPEIWDLGVRSS